tara:strand:+ start:254 stop:517 length:264 start_codon:yes stop_codon:yes gene_type:complete
MKGTRLKDVLDDKPMNKKTWDIIFGKLKKLGTAIEMYYGAEMDIDNVEYRWVDDRIKHYEKRNRLLTKEEMKIANFYWKKYHPTKNI